MLVEELLRCSLTRERPDIWQSLRGRIFEERKLVDRLLDKPRVRIYGFNTLPGHRDNETITKSDAGKINSEILTSHSIGGPPFFDRRTANLIGLAKVYSLAAGGSGISPEFYDTLINVVTSGDFEPLVPSTASYSSGDVIPGAHWAVAVLQHAGLKPSDLKLGEAMIMINGRFVQIGASTSLLPELRKFSCTLFESTFLMFSLTGVRHDSLQVLHSAERTKVSRALAALRGRLSHKKENDAITSSQASVSIRAFPEALDALFTAVSALADELNYSILKPYCNPYFQLTRPHYISQGGFLAPSLTSRVSAITDAVLFIGTMVVQRLDYVFSGKIDGVPIDGAVEGDLGLIQLPKLMMAKLDFLRSRLASRPMVFHVAASHGVEDLASYGILAINQLTDALDSVLELIRYEIAALTWLTKTRTGVSGLGYKREPFGANPLKEILEDLDQEQLENGDHWSAAFFPVKVS